MPQLLASRLLMVQMRLFFLACTGFHENPVFHSKSSMWSIQKWNPFCIVHLPSCNTTWVCFKTLFQATLLKVPLYIVQGTQKMTIFSWGNMIILWLYCISFYNYILIISGCARKSLCERHGSRRLHLKSEGDLAKGQKGKVDYTGLPHCQKQDHMICLGTIGAMYSRGIRSRNTENWD